MINKFQQGGQADLAIMLFVLGIAQELQADPQLVVLAAQQNPEALKAAVQVFLKTQDIKLAAQTFAQAVQQKTQAAKHGAKLNYIKSLKHQCAEDEEVYYFKKGGSVGCGCRKKEDGGEVTKASKGCSAIKKFKAERGKKVSEINPNDTIHINGQVKSLTGKNIKDGDKEYKNLTKEEYRKLKLKDKSKVDEKDAERGRQTFKCGSKIKKHENGAIATFKAKCGSKLKEGLKGLKTKTETYTNADGRGTSKIKRVITYREPTMKNDTTYYRTLPEFSKFLYSSTNDSMLKNLKKYKKDEEDFNRSKLWYGKN